MRTEDFGYELPEELIAQRPSAERGASRMLVLDAAAGALRDARFADFAEWLEAGDLLVLNDTRVIPARLYGHKRSGGRVEVLIERVLGEGRAVALVRASKGLREGAEVHFGADARALAVGREGGFHVLDFGGAAALEAALERYGHVPLPPYIERDDDAADRERYQTVYARRPGAVAAPTAGLHFDAAMLERLERKGVERAWVTLHVGAGTFQPVRAERVEDHAMHAERLEVSEETCARVAGARARGARVVAVGTTVVRALESAARTGTLRPHAGDTRLFLYPGCRFNVVDALLTNFHLPRSTLLMLVSAFAGRERMLAAYRHAVAERYRFFSYGDAMLIVNPPRAAGASDAGP